MVSEKSQINSSQNDLEKPVDLETGESVVLFWNSPIDRQTFFVGFALCGLITEAGALRTVYDGHCPHRFTRIDRITRRIGNGWIREERGGQKCLEFQTVTVGYATIGQRHANLGHAKSGNDGRGLKAGLKPSASRCVSARPLFLGRRVPNHAKLVK